MKHPMLLILGCEELRTPELDRSLQLKGWDSRWMEGPNGSGIQDADLEPTVLVANSGRLDASIQLIRAFRARDSFIPLILIGENAYGYPVNVDAFIPRGAPPDTWLASLKPYWPVELPKNDQPEEQGEVFGKYRLIRKIASGGSADIYKAEQLEPEGFKRVLAIKRLLPKYRQNSSFVRMMLDEANLAVQLNHQNIVRVMDIGTDSGAWYLAMEYVDGSNLCALISNAKELGIVFPEPVAAFLIAQAANALDYAHRKRDAEGRALNLVHRDISPQNILVDHEGAVKIIDFGIAKAVTPVQDQSQDAALKGKLLYMSPEQSAGLPTDHRSDTYSLGLVLFELLTAEHCFQADDEFGLLEKVRSGLVRDIKDVKADVSRPMVRILEKALQKNMSNRYRSAQMFARDLTAYLSHLNSPSLESDVITLAKMMQSATVQAKAFALSHFPPIKGNFVLPSEKEKSKKIDGEPTQEETMAGDKNRRPAWILPTLNVLMLLLAYLFWVLMNIE
ncbi:MAG: serine/threonine protein kinase [Holophagaceae bacterium]|nr:serine/threonine protein kinase [Holophagaceae bacterium]